MTDQPPKRIGRPPEPVPGDKAERILDALYAGRSLTAVCAEEGLTPRAVSYWKAKEPAFASEFARARHEGAAFLVDTAQDRADRATPENVQVVKLQCDLLVKRASCFDSQHFGTKPEQFQDNSRNDAADLLATLEEIRRRGGNAPP